eukprot:XP_020400991.1 atherin-like [Zea mays]
MRGSPLGVLPACPAVARPAPPRGVARSPHLARRASPPPRPHGLPGLARPRLAGARPWRPPPPPLLPDVPARSPGPSAVRGSPLAARSSPYAACPSPAAAWCHCVARGALARHAVPSACSSALRCARLPPCNQSDRII